MKKWEIKSQIDTNASSAIDAIITLLLRNRGLESKEKIKAFLNPSLADLHFDAVGIDKKQVDKTLERIKEAIEKKQEILIYGDYDVDGVTASAILWETIHTYTPSVLPYIPHRVEEGYGISIKGVENVLEKHPGTKLIITVDNGIVANEAIAFAKEKGLDVIITDHHVPPVGGVETLPDAFAIVHTTALCGAGIAYLVARALHALFDNPITATKDDLLELAALGTVADLVPLTGANRIIVTFGLPKLSSTRRVGLQELFKEAGCESTNIGVYEVGHIIAPRLNATGRMSSAMDSLRLLCTKDRKRAEELASLLGITNKERQNVMLEATNHAKLSVRAREELKKLIVVANDAYPEGVIGLVAGRLVEEHYRPAIVISKGEKYSKGSVRSISGFNIIEFLRNSSEFFVNVGGHPMAAGFTIETEKIEQMQQALEKLAEAVDDGVYVRTVTIDCELPLTAVTDSLFMAINTLGPFGMANPEPVFVTKNITVDDKRILGKEGKHLKLTVSQPNAVLEAIAFGMGDKAQDLQIGDTIDLAYTIDENNWNGRKKLQLKVKDLRKSTQT